MAVNEIQVDRLNSTLHKVLGMKEGAPAPVLAPEINATLVLEADRPEWLFAGNQRYGVAGIDLAPSVGNFGMFVILNPFGSGVMVVVERIEAYQATAGQGSLRGTSAVLAGYTAIQKWVRDGRSGWSSTTSLAAFVGTKVAASVDGTLFGTIGFDTGKVHRIVDQPFILAPTNSLIIGGGVTNALLGVNIWWRERVLEDSETR